MYASLAASTFVVGLCPSPAPFFNRLCNAQRKFVLSLCKPHACSEALTWMDGGTWTVRGLKFYGGFSIQMRIEKYNMRIVMIAAASRYSPGVGQQAIPGTHTVPAFQGSVFGAHRMIDNVLYFD